MIGYFDAAADKIAFQITKTLYKARVQPLTVTLFRFFVAAPTSWYFFSKGDFWHNVIGLILYISLALLDIVDGDLAVLYKLPARTKPYGRFIDHSSDRILMLIVIGAFFYAGMTLSLYREIWIALTILYYSSFFFLTAQMYEFDRTFTLDIATYPEIEKQIKKSGRPYRLGDKVLFNLLYPHNTTLNRLLFTQTFLLCIGILSNQLLPAFIMITGMQSLRSIGVFILEAKVLNAKPSDSVLVEILRKYRVS